MGNYSRVPVPCCVVPDKCPDPREVRERLYLHRLGSPLEGKGVPVVSRAPGVHHSYGGSSGIFGRH